MNNTEAQRALPAPPGSVERTTRTVIEHRLLTALEDDADKVTILATKSDLNRLIKALRGFTWGNELASGLEQLRAEAFPPNDQGQARRNLTQP